MTDRDDDYIQLDSDNDEETIENQGKNSATASINILSSRPLDLSTLGLGSGSMTSAPSARRSPASGGNSGAAPLVQRQHMRAEGAAANRIKSKTNVNYTQQILPLSAGVPVTSIASFRDRPMTNGALSCSGTQVSVSSEYRTAFGSAAGTRSSARLNAQNAVRSSSYGAGSVPLSADDMKEREMEKKNYEARLSRHTFEAFPKNNVQEDSPTMADASYRCTFGQCKRVIRGNVDFVCHVWAHLTTARGTDKERNDLAMISTCPQCIARFRTPNMMQVHYTRCHSRQKEAVQTGTCWICEKEVPRPKDMSRDMAIRAHMSLHELGEAPYHCKRCSYRTTVRLYLFDHFVQKHNNTGMLMCPFCTHTVEIPSYKRKRTAIQCSEFVEHMRLHLKYRSSCGRCAAVFLYNNEKFDHQKKEHVLLPPGWQMQSLTPGEWCRPKAVWKLKAKKSISRCRDCKRQDKGSMCATCLEEKYLKSALARRLKLEELDIETDRLGIDETQKDFNCYHCECGYSTLFGNVMSQHRMTCGMEFQVERRQIEKTQGTKEDAEQDELEARIFGVIPGKTLTELNREEGKIQRKRHANRNDEAALEVVFKRYGHQEQVHKATEEAAESLLAVRNIFKDSDEAIDQFMAILKRREEGGIDED